jgi:hypothetical protein
MKKISIEFMDVFEFKDDATEETIYDTLLDYLSECVKNKDVTAFDFVEVAND